MPSCKLHPCHESRARAERELESSKRPTLSELGKVAAYIARHGMSATVHTAGYVSFELAYTQRTVSGTWQVRVSTMAQARRELGY